MDFGKIKFFIKCLTTLNIQLKCCQSLHTYNVLRHSACSLAVTEAGFSFLDSENKTPKTKWIKGIWGQKSNKWYKSIPLEKRLQGLKALATIPCVLVKMSYITQPPGLYR